MAASAFPDTPRRYASLTLSPYTSFEPTESNCPVDCSAWTAARPYGAWSGFAIAMREMVPDDRSSSESFLSMSGDDQMANRPYA